MQYNEAVHRWADDPEQLELAYRRALQAGEGAAFEEAIHARHAAEDHNVLLAAWHHRFAHGAARAARRAIAWSVALPIAVTNGLLLWLVSDEQRYRIAVTNPVNGNRYDVTPAVVLVAAPLTAAAVAAFLTLVAKRGGARAVAAVLALAALTAYVLFSYGMAGPRPFQEQYIVLMVMHLALFGWACVGVVALGGRRDAHNRFAFLAKSLEYVIVAGIAAGAGGVFAAVTIGLFQALGVSLPVLVVRLIVAGGAGVIAVLTAALVYDPRAAPVEQSFDDGPSRTVATLLRVLLPMCALVLAVYVLLIPFHFRAPFEARGVLIAYNAMLFAVMALLVGATPVRGGETPPATERWLRAGIVALAALALVVGVYALTAVVYRTAMDRLTPNRLAFIGWNAANLLVLGRLLLGQLRVPRAGWLAALQGSLAFAVVPYLGWALAVALVTPWWFRSDTTALARLPEALQEIAFEAPEPVLLKCAGSPHIYRLERGRKRWIRDIPTFTQQGYHWRDVRFAPCAAIDAVPDGPPVPPDAGPPPGPGPGTGG